VVKLRLIKSKYYRLPIAFLVMGVTAIIAHLKALAETPQGAPMSQPKYTVDILDWRYVLRNAGTSTTSRLPWETSELDGEFILTSSNSMGVIVLRPISHG